MESSGIAACIVACLRPQAERIQVAEVRIGLGYTAVLLADNRLGVAYTFRNMSRSGCSIFNGLRPLIKRPASDLLTLLKSNDPIESAVGLACANALANRDDGSFQNGDILDQIHLRSDDRVGMVGYFGPLISKIKEQAESLTVFEQVEEPTDILQPTREAGQLLPRCQVVLITATSIINHSIDILLKAAENCREVAVLGASTPLLPEAFAKEKVTILSGVVVKNPTEVLRVVSEGGGMRFFGPYLNKVCQRTDAA